MPEPNKVVKIHGGLIVCQFCHKELDFKAKRTKDGYWACSDCKVTVLKQVG